MIGRLIAFRKPSTQRYIPPVAAEAWPAVRHCRARCADGVADALQYWHPFDVLGVVDDCMKTSKPSLPKDVGTGVRKFNTKIDLGHFVESAHSGCSI